MSGDAALAYARSRHYQYEENGRWKEDGSSDRGRIRRQQDFIKRMLRKAIDRGGTRPDVAKKLIDTALKYVRVDADADRQRPASRWRLACSSSTPARSAPTGIDGKGTTSADPRSSCRPFRSRATKNVLKLFRGDAYAGRGADRHSTRALRGVALRRPPRHRPSTPPRPHRPGPAPVHGRDRRQRRRDLPARRPVLPVATALGPAPVVSVAQGGSRARRGCRSGRRRWRSRAPVASASRMAASASSPGATMHSSSSSRAAPRRRRPRSPGSRRGARPPAGPRPSAGGGGPRPRVHPPRSVVP